jgi:hypothetical protein
MVSNPDKPKGMVGIPACSLLDQVLDPCGAVPRSRMQYTIGYDSILVGSEKTKENSPSS